MKRILLVLLLVPALASAKVYKCSLDGSIAYQDKPCQQGTQEQVSLKYSSGKGSKRVSAPAQQAAPQTATSLETIRGINDQRERDQKSQSLRRDMKKSNSKIEKHLVKMQVELRVLELKKLRANNNLAGATWENSLSNEMRAVTEKYNALT